MAWKKTDEEIIAYLSGDLSPDEKEAFELRLKDDLALAEAMARHLRFEEKLREQGAFRQFSEELNELNNQFPKQKIGSNTKLYLFVAAAFLALLIFIFLNKNQSITYCPEDLFVETFEVKDAPDLAGQAQNVEQILRMAHSHFNQEEFPKAFDLYKQVLEDDNLSRVLVQEARFYSGQCLIKNLDFFSAIGYFSQIKEGPYFQQAEWNIALSNLALGKRENAREIFDKISKIPSHDRFKEANEVLSKWGSLKDC